MFTNNYSTSCKGNDSRILLLHFLANIFWGKSFRNVREIRVEHCWDLIEFAEIVSNLLRLFLMFSDVLRFAQIVLDFAQNLSNLPRLSLICSDCLRFAQIPSNLLRLSLTCSHCSIKYSKNSVQNHNKSQANQINFELCHKWISRLILTTMIICIESIAHIVQQLHLIKHQKRNTNWQGK